MHACEFPSRFVWVITSSFMHEFQTYLTQFLFLRRSSVIWNIFLGRLKVKVTHEVHINELFWAITPTFMHGFQNNFAQVSSLKSGSAIWNIWSCTYTYPPPPFLIPPPFTPPSPPPPPPAKKKKKRSHTHLPPQPAQFFLIWIICQLDSVLVIFLQIDKESIFFWVGRGGLLWRGGGEWT